MKKTVSKQEMIERIQLEAALNVDMAAYNYRKAAYYYSKNDGIRGKRCNERSLKYEIIANTLVTIFEDDYNVQNEIRCAMRRWQFEIENKYPKEYFEE